MNKFKFLAAAAAAAGGLALAGTAQATTYVCVDSAAAVCSFDGSSGGWRDLKVAKNATVTQSFALVLNTAGTLDVSITSTYLDLLSLSFGGVTLTGLSKGVPYSFAVSPSSLGQILTVVMRNPKNTAYGYSSQIDFAAAVPEPATWGMMIAGFGMAGAAIRRRRPARAAIA